MHLYTVVVLTSVKKSADERDNADGHHDGEKAAEKAVQDVVPDSEGNVKCT